MPSRTITLPCYGITVTLGEPDPDWNRPGAFLGGSITSEDLHETEDGPEADCYNAAIDAVESFILAAANAGIDITTLALIEAIETTVDAITNNLG